MREAPATEEVRELSIEVEGVVEELPNWIGGILAGRLEGFLAYAEKTEPSSTTEATSPP